MRHLFLLFVVAVSIVAGAQSSPKQGPDGKPVRKSPLADYAGTWTGMFEGKTWLTVNLVLQGDRLLGSIQRPRNLQYNDLGEIKSIGEEQFSEAVEDAQVNPDGLLLTVKDPDTKETDRYTMKLNGESMAEIKMSAMKMPPGMPKIKPWKVTKTGASPAVVSH